MKDDPKYDEALDRTADRVIAAVVAALTLLVGSWWFPAVLLCWAALTFAGAVRIAQRRAS